MGMMRVKVGTCVSRITLYGVRKWKAKVTPISKDFLCNKVIYQFSRSGGRIAICWQHWAHTFQFSLMENFPNKLSCNRMHGVSTQQLCNAKESLSIVKCNLFSMGTKEAEK